MLQVLKTALYTLSSFSFEYELLPLKRGSFFSFPKYVFLKLILSSLPIISFDFKFTIKSSNKYLFSFLSNMNAFFDLIISSLILNINSSNN